MSLVPHESNGTTEERERKIPLTDRQKQSLVRTGVCQENDMLLGQAASLFKERLVRVFQY